MRSKKKNQTEIKLNCLKIYIFNSEKKVNKRKIKKNQKKLKERAHTEEAIWCCGCDDDDDDENKNVNKTHVMLARWFSFWTKLRSDDSVCAHRVLKFKTDKPANPAHKIQTAAANEFCMQCVLFVAFAHTSHSLSLSGVRSFIAFCLSPLRSHPFRWFVSLSFCCVSIPTHWIQYDCCRFIFSTLFVALHCSQLLSSSSSMSLVGCLIPFHSPYLCSVVMSLLPMLWSLPSSSPCIVLHASACTVILCSLFNVQAPNNTTPSIRIHRTAIKRYHFGSVWNRMSCKMRSHKGIWWCWLLCCPIHTICSVRLVASTSHCFICSYREESVIRDRQWLLKAMNSYWVCWATNDSRSSANFRLIVTRKELSNRIV